MLAERFGRLNALARINGAEKYLEIGVNKGSTFMRVDVPYRVGVDPKFNFDTASHANLRTIFHEVTSDFFFSHNASEHGEFDLIYLDGLHTSEQTFRDFCASLASAHQSTIWLIDDTYPTSWFASFRNRWLANTLRRCIRCKDGSWMGDVYRVVFAIHDLFPQFSYATFPGHGQTAVWRAPRTDFTPNWNSPAGIWRLTYRDLLKYKDPFMRVWPPAKILEAIERDLKRSSEK